MPYSTQPPEMSDPIVKRNYHLMYHYLIYLLDSGLDYLKRLYIKNNNDSPFKQFSANSYFTFILKDYIRNRIKTQIRIILHTAVECLDHLEGDRVKPRYLDYIIDKHLGVYYQNDLTLLNTSKTHPAHLELKQISKITYRIAVIQAVRMLQCKTEGLSSYEELAKCTFKDYDECWQSVNAILSMFDQMIDCFEQNLDMIVIPFYNPTFTMRDFQYVRKIYEYALQILDDQLRFIFNENEEEIEDP